MRYEKQSIITRELLRNIQKGMQETIVIHEFLSILGDVMAKIARESPNAKLGDLTIRVGMEVE